MGLRTFVGLLLLSAFAGCDAVSVDTPFGDLADTDQCRALCGVWSNEKGEVFVEMVPGAVSELSLSVRHRSEPATTKVFGKQRLLVRRVEDLTFVFAPFDSVHETRYTMVHLVRLEDGAVSIGMCNAAKFRLAVMNGLLDGTLAEKEGHISEIKLVSTQRLYDLLRSPEGAEYFLLDHDAAFRREP